MEDFTNAIVDENEDWGGWLVRIKDEWLNPGEAPNVKFLLGDEKPLAVYAYCNLHGLWKADVE